MKRSSQFTLILITFLLLLTWGIATLLMYFGIPNHLTSLLPDSSLATVQSHCPGSNLLCFGAYGLWPVIQYTFTRVPIVTVYGVIIAVIYGVILFINMLRTGYAHHEYTLRPWHFFAAFIALVWILFTVLTLRSAPEGQLSPLQIVGPDKAVYQGLSNDGLVAIGSYTEALHDRGCLKVTGMTANQFEVYTMRYPCVQGFFVARVLSQYVVLLLAVTLFISTGLWVFKKFAIDFTHLFLRYVLALVTGTIVWIALLWCLALSHMYFTAALWLLVVIITALTHKQIKQVFHMFIQHPIHVKAQWYNIGVLAGIGLLALLAMNFLSVIRPFPVGWDDLGVYLNEPRLLVSYGFMTPFMSPMRWEYITSLGFGLFGYDSTFATTTSLLLNWFAGALAVLSILLTSQGIVRWRTAILAGLLYYILPIIGHFSFADMKTDNAVFMYQFIPLVLVAFSVLPSTAASHSVRKMMMLGGAILAFGYATKPTTVMMVFSIFAFIALYFTGYAGFIAVASAAFLILSFLGTLSLPTILAKTGISIEPSFIQLFFATIFIISVFIIFFKKSKQIIPTYSFLWPITLLFLLCISPWIILINVSNDFTALHPYGYIKDSLSPQLSYLDLPEELAVDLTSESCVGTAKNEELDRYWGYRTGLRHYLMLPWRSIMNLDIFGYYVTSYHFVLLLPLIFFVPWFWFKDQKVVRAILASTLLYSVFWIFLGNGVIWYGIGMFGGIVLILSALVNESPLPTKTVFVGFVALSLISAFSLRLWQFQQQLPMFDYAYGRVDERILAERTIPHYDNIRSEVERMRKDQPDQSYLYRIGTFIPYFLPKNLEVFGITDHQLDFFNCLSFDSDYPKTLERMQALGFGSIIFDTNTATIEKVPGSLNKKVDKFVEFLNTPGLGIKQFVADSRAGVGYFILPKK
jgi:hypothetical protein